jgi:hypothetical protein
MKSRPRITFLKPKDRVNVTFQHSRSNQEIASGEVGTEAGASHGRKINQLEAIATLGIDIGKLELSSPW